MSAEDTRGGARTTAARSRATSVRRTAVTSSASSARPSKQVRGWAAQGVPLKIALRGIDLCCERLSPRVRGAGRSGSSSAPQTSSSCSTTGGARSASRRPGRCQPREAEPAIHVERVVSRLIALRSAGGRGAAGLAIDETVQALDRIAGRAHGAQGDQRDALIDELAAIDARPGAAAAAGWTRRASQRLRREAEEELAPFGAAHAVRGESRRARGGVPAARPRVRAAAADRVRLSRMLPPGDRFELAIEKPARGGAMIARHDGQVLLVSGAIPGERVAARHRARRAAARLRRGHRGDRAVARPSRGGRRSAVRRLPLRAHRDRAPAGDQGRGRRRRLRAHRTAPLERRGPGRGVARCAATACAQDCTSATAGSVSFGKGRTSCVTRPARAS